MIFAGFDRLYLQTALMLLSEPFFKTFTKQALCDTSKATEGLFALSCESKAEVEQLVKKAVVFSRPRRPPRIRFSRNRYLAETRRQNCVSLSKVIL